MQRASSRKTHGFNIRLAESCQLKSFLTISQQLKRFFRCRFGITAPRVVVRGHLSWQWLALLSMFVLFSLGVAAWFLFQLNEASGTGREVQNLRQQLLDVQEELVLLRSTAGTGKNAASIERVAQQQLLTRIQGLERENGVLKEDIRLFERLIPIVGEEAVVRVENFRVIGEAGWHYRYRLLLAFQPSRQNPEFKGRLQLVVKFSLAGNEQQLVLPDKPDLAGNYHLELKHFLRRESGFELPPGAQLRGVEAHVLQGDTLKVKQMAQL